MGDDHVEKLPLRILGLDDMPAVPVDLEQIPETLVRLGLRAAETKQSTHGLSNVYSIGGKTAPAYPFLFGSSETTESSDEGSGGSFLGGLVAGAKDKVEGLVEDGVQKVKDMLGSDNALREVPPERFDKAAEARRDLYDLVDGDPSAALQLLSDKASKDDAPDTLAEASTDPWKGLSLDRPEQFSMSWTTFPDIYRRALPRLGQFAASLEDAEVASRQFWPTLAGYGLPLNLLILRKIADTDIDPLRLSFGRAFDESMAAAARQGRLYAIDLTIFETLKPQQVDGATRFTPSTITLLRQDAETLELEPIAVRVAGEGGSGGQFFVRGQATPSAWLYALQAAKASITVYGIWLGHVYHWHIVTAAMQMTMFNNLDADHPIRQLLDPQSDYLIAFDQILLLLWSDIAPPTSVTSAFQFLRLLNQFAKGRDFFDDDPTTALRQLGLREEDFSFEKPWDRYPVVGQLLEVWRSSESYATAFVEHTFKDDQAVREDEPLQKWIEDSGDPDGGNVRGLPAMDSRAALSRVLTSLIFRVTVHGTARLEPAANPGLSFVANFPPTLQSCSIPGPDAVIDTPTLLTYLPQTGTIGGMVTFLFTFSFSAPYVPLIPLDGVETDLYFPSGDPCNDALIAYRNAALEFMKVYEDGAPQVNQWPRNIET